MKCPKCGSEMEKGRQVSEGLSGKLIWMKEDKHIKIGAPSINSYSCLKCGFIESYTER